jgi:hypothetical protein
LAELVDQLTKGIVVIAEPQGGVLLGEAVDKDGAEGLVLTLGGTAGLLKEGLAEGVVHAYSSECESMVEPLRSEASRSGVAPPAEKPVADAWESLENKGESGKEQRRRTLGSGSRKCWRGGGAVRNDLTRSPPNPGQKRRFSDNRVRSFGSVEIGDEEPACRLLLT